MSKDYQKQYDEAYEVLEVAESEGFKTLMQEVNQSLASITQQIETAQKDMIRAIKDGGLDSEVFVQTLTYLNAKKEGLQFISSRLELFRKRRDEASKKLEQ